MKSNTSRNPGDTREQIESATPRVRVWDLPTRVFHWTLVLSFAAAWLSADSERYRNLHLMMGYTFAGAIVFRLIWGLLGSRYARFSSFIFNRSELFDYLGSLLSRRPRHYLGHNPAGAVAIFAMLGLGVAVASSGIAAYQEVGGEWMEELHEWLATTLLAVVAVHVLGVIVSSVLHRENLAMAMLTGWKAGRSSDGIESVRPLVGMLLLAGVVAFWLTYSNLPMQPELATDSPAATHAGTPRHLTGDD
ncbi:MAG: cytochrome b/b6 domain-containing protein [Gammaproteobacteria bacterium]